MLSTDAGQMHDLVFRLEDKRFSGLLGLGIPPFVCFFVIEAYECLRRSGQKDVDVFLEVNAKRIRRLRARLKVFVDHDGYDAALDRMAAVQRGSAGLFRAEDPGLLGALRRALQTDLGLYFIGPDLVCTTHVALSNFGLSEANLDNLDPESLPALTADVVLLAEQLGQFLRNKFGPFASPASPVMLLQQMDTPTEEDYRATDAYRRIAIDLGIHNATLAAQFTYLVAQVNYAHIALRSLLEPDSDLLLRFQFLTLFHAADELKRLGAITRGSTSHELGRLLADLQSRPRCEPSAV